jgi:aldose 1-epimerase
MKPRISTEQRGDRTILGLHDDATGASAHVLPSYGFNLFDLKLPAAGEPRSLVVSEPGWEAQPQKPARHGFPVLFPFPNRIREGRYSWNGKDYQLPLGKPPHAIHGFAADADWQVVEHAVSPAGATLLGRYQISRQSPQMLPSWPGDLILEMRYTLAGRTLDLDITITNPGGDDVPYGLGFHPYFRLPFSSKGTLEQTRVVIPAGEFWVLEGAIPTGERRPVDSRLDFRAGQPMAGLQLDDVLTALEPKAAAGGDRWTTCRLIDDSLQAELQLLFDANFREIVVFTPPGSPDVIAVEPYTQTTDAIHLHERGIDGGLRLLKHGAQDHLCIRLQTSG